MTVAIIGAYGVVGKVFVEHLKRLGCIVLEVDRTTALTLREAASQADAVFVFTLPISEVGSLVEEASACMRRGTLLVHGTSIANPSTGPIDGKSVVERGISFAHLHLHFRPQAPLAMTLFGQHVTLCYDGDEQWKHWLEEEVLQPFKPVTHELAEGVHDAITRLSQVVHMIIAYLVSSVWWEHPPAEVVSGLEIGGPPLQLLKLAVLRIGLGAEVAANILVNHPSTLATLATVEEAIRSLRNAVEAGNIAQIVRVLQIARTEIIPADDLARHDDDTACLARLKADLAQPSYRFTFPPTANQTGLLVRVLQEFDLRGVDKTSTIAQVLPNGGCLIIVGVRERSDKSEEAAGIVHSWT